MIQNIYQKAFLFLFLLPFFSWFKSIVGERVVVASFIFDLFFSSKFYSAYFFFCLPTIHLVQVFFLYFFHFSLLVDSFSSFQCLNVVFDSCSRVSHTHTHTPYEHQHIIDKYNRCFDINARVYLCTARKFQKQNVFPRLFFVSISSLILFSFFSIQIKRIQKKLMELHHHHHHQVTKQLIDNDDDYQSRSVQLCLINGKQKSYTKTDDQIFSDFLSFFFVI